MELEVIEGELSGENVVEGEVGADVDGIEGRGSMVRMM
jgi:hypothetical protein